MADPVAAAVVLALAAVLGFDQELMLVELLPPRAAPVVAERTVLAVPDAARELAATVPLALVAALSLSVLSTIDRTHFAASSADFWK